jgi:hypothetical protein
MPFDRKCWERHRNNLILNHYNAPCHISLAVQQFLVKKLIPTFPQPPYSTGLTPHNFQNFTAIHVRLSGHCSVAAEEIQQNATAGLTAISKKDSQRCFQQ